MGASRSREIAVAGAGIAGLTAGLAFAAKGFSVTIFEQAPVLEEAGAGLQLSPNATRLLSRLGVIEALGHAAVRPQAIRLRRAGDLAPLARLPLGAAAEARWAGPYLVAHRADLQNALIERAEAEARITLRLAAGIEDVRFGAGQVTPVLTDGADAGRYALLIGADGVWSKLRLSLPGAAPSRFSGYVAWRAISSMDDIRAGGLDGAIRPDEVTALLNPRFHLVAYPLRGGESVNLVAVTKGTALAKNWSSVTDPAPLIAATRSAHPALARLAGASQWTAWPIFAAAEDGAWTRPEGLALVGDAAHAMTPFAAQGAAMAIEDAVALAECVAGAGGDLAGALRAYEERRRRRVQRVASRGRFNRFVWHAAGLAALGRDMVLGLRPERSLMKDFDWLYGWEDTDAFESRSKVIEG